MSRIILTGDRGKLGTELKKHLSVTGIDYDITGIVPKEKCDLIIHAAAYTDVANAEEDSRKCFDTNVYGTYNLVRAYADTPFVYISTEYAKNPLGVYALSKYLGEEVVKLHKKYLIIRTLFKPNPWPFPVAYNDQYTQGDYVDVIAPLIVKKIQNWNKGTSELCYIGTGRKTMYELAKRTRPDVLPNSVKESRSKFGDIIPFDYQ